MRARDRDQGARLGREFFVVDAVVLAKRLIGTKLVRRLDDGTRVAGVIVETEAYLGAEDKAAHTFGGRRTPRNEAMYGVGGTAYVYFTYGMHYCMNVVAGRVDEPVAVLLRALEPVEGIERIRELRGARARKAVMKDRELCSGPGRLCQGLAIDRSLNGVDLVSDSRLWVEAGREYGTKELVVTGRVGIASAEEWVDRPLRWYVRGNPHVSVRAKVE